MSRGSPAPRAFALSYLDRLDKALASSLLLACDEASQDGIPATHPLSADWSESSGSFWTENGSVMRTNTLEILDRRGCLDRSAVFVRSRLTKVGTTSWQTESTVYRDAAGQEPVARVWGVNVMVDRLGLRPKPLPQRELLSTALIKPRPSAHVPTEHDRPVPARAFCWETWARATDCDSLGHLNNTKYASLAEEAMATAVHFGAFDESVRGAADSVATMHIEQV